MSTPTGQAETSTPGTPALTAPSLTPTLLRTAAAALRDDWGQDWQAADPSAPFHLALADLLDTTADSAEHHIAAWSGPGRDYSEPAGIAYGKPDVLARTIEHHYGQHRAIAFAYLQGR